MHTVRVPHLIPPHHTHTHTHTHTHIKIQVSEMDGLLDGDDAAEQAREKVIASPNIQYFVYHKMHANPCTHRDRLRVPHLIPPHHTHT